MQQAAVLHPAQAVEVGHVHRREAHRRQLGEHGLRRRRAGVVVDQRDLDQDVVRLAKNRLAAAQHIQFRALGVDLDEVEAATSEEVVHADLGHRLADRHLVAEEVGILAIDRGAGRLQPFLGQEQLGLAALVGSGRHVPLVGQLGQRLLTERIGLDHDRRAIRKGLNKGRRKSPDVRTDIQHGARRVAVELQRFQLLPVHAAPPSQRRPSAGIALTAWRRASSWRYSPCRSASPWISRSSRSSARPMSR